MDLFTAARVYSDVNPKDKGTAIAEIVLLMLGSFLLGYLFRHIFCRHHHNDTKRVAAPAPRKAAPVVAAAAPKRPAPPAPTPRPIAVTSKNPDDLTVVEGIGPKINTILHSEGIRTYADLASASYATVKTILDKQGPRYRIHDPKSWAAQSALARDGKWNELETMKDKLTGGR